MARLAARPHLTQKVVVDSRNPGGTADDEAYDDGNQFERHGDRQLCRIKAAYHFLTRMRLLDAVSGFVCLGSKLGDFYSRYGKPVCVIGNGFDTSSVRPRSSPHNPRPKPVFVGSRGQPWHGVDKLVEVAAALPEMDFHIVGEAAAGTAANFVAHGYLDWPRLRELYSTTDVGIGTLALHRIGMNEITPLKTREYLAHGLPVIGAYDDIDLRESAFFLRLPNTESGVRDSIDPIGVFVLNWKDRPIDMNEVTQRIDSRHKEAQRLAGSEAYQRYRAVTILARDADHAPRAPAQP